MQLQEFDETRETDLVPGGKDIVVNNENRMQYISSVAHYRLNTQILRCALLRSPNTIWILLLLSLS